MNNNDTSQQSESQPESLPESLPEGLRENHREQRAQEQRQEYRLNNQLTVIIELDSPADSEPTLVVSTSIDISANGLRAISPQAVPTDNILRCCIRDAASDQQFLVVTEVKWCRAHGEHGDFLIGLSLFDSTGTDIVEWKEFIAQRYAE